MEKGVQILVVDDDDFLRDAVVEILEPHFTVRSAVSGKSAFEIVKASPVDIVLSDVSMADGTGIELLEWIRARNPVVPTVVLVTGYSSVTSEEAVRKGAHSVINKPFGSAVLLDAIKKIVTEQILPLKKQS